MPPGDEYLKKYYKLKVKERSSYNTVLFNINREYKKESWNKFPRQMQSLPGFIKNLNFDHHLQGHRGCVNCIEFSEDGRHLISGSDDTKVILWDIARLRSKKIFNTGHRGNIFSVKFLPKSADNYIVSGAGDSRIEVKNLSSGDTVASCQCHLERVKRIATLPMSSDVYFSASEDGTVRQFDRRERHSCGPWTNNIIVDLRNLSEVKLEAKCVTVNPIQTEIMAVGATDAYIRVYDRRKLSVTSTEDLSNESSMKMVPPKCLQYYTPGPLPQKMNLFSNRLFKTLAITCLTYSSNGRELLANIGGDHVYLFDTQNATLPKNYSVQPRVNREINNFSGSGINLYSRAFQSESHSSRDALRLESLGYLFPCGINSRWYPQEVKDLISKTNSLPKLDEVILEFLNNNIHFWPYSTELFLARANVYLHRNWDGDSYSALRDCEKCLQLDSTCKKALFMKIICLHYMQKDDEALYEMEADSDIMDRLIAKETYITAIYEFLSNSREWKKKRRKSHFSYRKITPDDKNIQLNLEEKRYRSLAKDYSNKYNGHCNTTTDIKEATFIGSDCEYIATGSDDGNVFIWDRKTSNLVHVFNADQSIVNCVQFHPGISMMATSGIENVIKLWTPKKASCKLEGIDRIVRYNQLRMTQDPLEVMRFDFPVEALSYDNVVQQYNSSSSDENNDDNEDHNNDNEYDMTFPPVLGGDSSCRTS